MVGEDQVPEKCFQKLRCWGVVQSLCMAQQLLSNLASEQLCSKTGGMYPIFSVLEFVLRQPELALHPARLAPAELSCVV